MEFPSLGKQCHTKECKSLDFLPIKCPECQLIFCKDHAQSHNCQSSNDNIVTEKKKLNLFNCNAEDCTTKDALEMKCVVCEKHFCLEHRHHGCLDKEPSQSKRDKYKIPKEQFKKAKAETDKQVDDTLRNAKNRALANKIKLMKIKGSAIGHNNIPTVERCFFLVAPPLGNKEKSIARPFFINKTWPLGKGIDFFSKKFKIENTNNNTVGPILRLFSFEGSLITNDINKSLVELLTEGLLLDGDSLILEYINMEEAANRQNIFKDDSLSKYYFV